MSLFILKVLAENVHMCRVHCVGCVHPACHPKKSGHLTAALHFMSIITGYMRRKCCTKSKSVIHVSVCVRMFLDHGVVRHIFKI